MKTIKFTYKREPVGLRITKPGGKQLNENYKCFYKDGKTYIMNVELVFKFIGYKYSNNARSKYSITGFGKTHTIHIVKGSDAFEKNNYILLSDLTLALEKDFNFKWSGKCWSNNPKRASVVLKTKGSGNVPGDVLSLMNAPIDSTWGISDSAAEAWFLSTNTAVIAKYSLNSTNIGNITVAIKAVGVSPVLFYAYTVNEGGGLGGFINHYNKNYYANNGGDTAENAASGDAQYLADQSKIMDSRPAWVDLGQKPPLRIDFVPQSVKDSGNASFASMPSGSIGRAYIPATAAATWEVFYPDGLLKSYNKVQNYGAPMKGVLSFIVAMSKY